MKETRIRMVVNNRNVVVNNRLLILFYFPLLVILGTDWMHKADIHLNQWVSFKSMSVNGDKISEPYK